MGAKKNFVLDTNVILHDYKCIENFQENDIYLPIVVLEELDKFKKGSDQINYNAREFVRELDTLTSNDLFLKGASLGPGKGTLHVVTGDKYQEKIYQSFPEKTADHRILSCTLSVAESEKDRKVKTILVTKDVNLRMKARSLGIEVEDYITDKVINVDIFKRAQDIYENIDPDLIDKMYASPDGIDADLFDIKSKLEPNECFILKSVRNSVLARYNPFTNKFKKVEKASNYGIQPRNAEQRFRETERYCFRVLCDYLRLLEHWKTAYAPQPQDAIWHPLFVEALQRISYTEYLLDILLYGEIEEKAALIAAQGKEVLRLEQRISELAAGNAGSGQKDDGHNGTGADTGRNPGNIRGDAERRREEQHPKLPDGVPA